MTPAARWPYAVAVVDVHLLGPIVVGSDGAVPLGGPKQRGLFALLAGSVPPRRTDEQLVQALWGEQPPASARNAVQVYVTGLRRALQPLGIEISRAGDGYTLTGTALEVDSVRFETTVAQGRAALRGGDAERAADLLHTALGLWAGVPFDGVGDQPVVQQWRAALASTRQGALLDLATALVRTGRHDEAIATAQALVTDHAYDERGWVAMATAQYWAGRQSDALETCSRARDLLGEELGVDPGPELAGLSTLILRHEMPEIPAAPVAGPQEEDVPGGSALPSLPPGPDPFLGREEGVQEVLDLVSAGRRVVTLVGMGGIGKTTLAVAVAHRLRAQQRAVLFCELEAETDAVSALDRICRDLDVDPQEDPGAAIAGGPAEVIVLDNAEQVVGLAAALDAIVRRHAKPLFLVTCRTPVGVRGEHTLLVPPLTVAPGEGEQSPATELFWATASRVQPVVDRAREDQAVRRLCDLLGGIPLAIEIVAGRTRAQSPTMLLRRVEQGRLSLLDTASAGQLPARQATLRVVIGAAAASMSEPARKLLHLAGAIDGWVRQETLEDAASEVSDGDFLAALEDLTGHGLASVDGTGRLRLAPPVRDFVRGHPDEAETVQSFLPVLVARAEDLGGQLYGPEAGAALEDLSGDADTISTVLNRAVEPSAPPGTVRAAARLLIGLRRYWLLSSRIPEARRTAAALRAHAALGELDRARLGILDGNLAQWMDDPAARPLLEAALVGAASLGAPSDRLLVSGWCSLAAQAATYHEAAAAASAVQHAAAAAEDSGDPSLVALVQDLEGYVAHQLGDYETALRCGLLGLEHARVSGDDYDIVSLLNGTSEVLSELGRDAEAVAMSDEAFDRATRLTGRLQDTMGLLIRSAVQVAAGQVATARGSVLEALRGARLYHPTPKTFADGLRILAAVEAAHGRDEEVARLIGAAMAMRDDVHLDSEELTESRIGRLTNPSRERLGDDAWRVLGATGAADPMGVVDRLLADAG